MLKKIIDNAGTAFVLIFMVLPAAILAAPISIIKLAFVLANDYVGDIHGDKK
jgi:hypothetical protein